MHKLRKQAANTRNSYEKIKHYHKIDKLTEIITEYIQIATKKTMQQTKNKLEKAYFDIEIKLLYNKIGTNLEDCRSISLMYTIAPNSPNISW